MRRGVHRPSARTAVRAEVLRLRGGRRALALVVCAIVAGTAAIASTALLAGALGPTPLEAGVVAVHRGSAASTVVALAVGLLVGADHRHGTAALAWMQLGGRRRLMVVAGVQAALAAAIALLAAGVALAAIAAVVDVAVGAALLALVVHVGLMALWSAWLVCVATLTGSTLVTLVCGVVVPLVVEPAAAGALTVLGAPGAQRLLPSTALRMLGELAAVGERVVLAPAAPSDAWIVPSVVAIWTVLLLGLTWWRAARAP